MKIFQIFAYSILLIFALSFPVFSQKMKVEDIIAKHLDSIGTKEKRDEVKNQMVLANVKLFVKGSSAAASGKAVILSERKKNLWGMNFDSNEYPMDRFGYNGNETKVGYMVPGTRSVLGGFLLSYDELLDESLLGGTLLSSWALLNTDSKKPKISYDGIKKIDGKETYVLNYSPKKGSDLDIKIYLDAQNFQHIRTEYARVIAARQGPTIDGSAGQGADRYRLVEDFSGFQKAGNLTLPTNYNFLTVFQQLFASIFGKIKSRSQLGI